MATSVLSKGTTCHIIEARWLDVLNMGSFALLLGRSATQLMESRFATLMKYKVRVFKMFMMFPGFGARVGNSDFNVANCELKDPRHGVFRRILMNLGRDM
jgi:hypothetical protein